MHPNVETFIGCDSSYRAASIVLYGACLLYTSPSPRD